MIIGAHSIIYTKDAEADRAFLRDILKFPNVDVGGGWLIFGLPPAEVALHPGNNDEHEFYLMCDDVAAFVRDMKARGRACSEVQPQPWGLLTQLTLPGGGKLGVYEPRHGRPPSMVVAGGKGKETGARKSKATAAARAKATTRPGATAKAHSKPKPKAARKRVAR